MVSFLELKKANVTIGWLCRAALAGLIGFSCCLVCKRKELCAVDGEQCVVWLTPAGESFREHTRQTTRVWSPRSSFSSSSRTAGMTSYLQVALRRVLEEGWWGGG